MKDVLNHEQLNRGTPDFQIELYDVSEGHPKYNMQYHWHNKYEIIYIWEGTLTLTLNGKTMILTKGQSIFIPTGVIHGGTPINCRYKCVVFSTSILHASQKCRSIMKSQINSVIILNKDTLIKSITKDMERKDVGYEFSVIGKLYILISRILKANKDIITPLNKEYDKIKPALSYIEENYYNDIPLNNLASICSMNKNYFCKAFKNVTNETPMLYIQRFRIEKASEFLLSGTSITDTAYACGFNDTSYFIHIFKKYMDTTPKKYIKSKN